MDDKTRAEIRAHQEQVLARITSLTDKEKKHYVPACGIAAEDRSDVGVFLDQVTDRVIAISKALNSEDSLPRTDLGILDRNETRDQVWDHLIIAISRALAYEAGDAGGHTKSSFEEDNFHSAGFTVGALNIDFHVKSRNRRDESKRVVPGQLFTAPIGDVNFEVEAMLALAWTDISAMRVKNPVAI